MHAANADSLGGSLHILDTQVDLDFLVEKYGQLMMKESGWEEVVQIDVNGLTIQPSRASITGLNHVIT